MNTRTIYSALLLTISLSTIACGDPCLPVVGDTFIIAADDECLPIPEDETGRDPTEGESSSGDLTDGATTDSDSTGASVMPPMCQPPSGQEWAPCDIDGLCDAGSKCVFGDSNTAWICAPDYDAPCEVSPCMLAQQKVELVTLDATNLICGYQCQDSSDCDSGMVCGQTKTAKVCMWTMN